MATDDDSRSDRVPEEDRIAVLSAGLADQIAAGEVVERPGSIVKELIENAVDAGATRIEVELEDGGREGIRIIDDGRGIHRDDLLLAVTRHATSKLRLPEQLVEIVTLGFRGEALASIAAVARLEIRSRRPGEAVGHRLALRPGERPAIEPIGMPPGTQIEVGKLFANVPARRKFLRSEATEVGHCVDAVIRTALVHPAIHFKVRHGGRELLDLPACSLGARVTTVLTRRGGEGPYVHFRGDRQGVAVEGWFAPPTAATRQRSAGFVVVRRRVVSERTLAGVLKQAYGDALPRGTHAVACLFVDPPAGSVDVNVHPQKSEVRFAEAQRVYAAVRELVEEGLANAPWRRAGRDPGAIVGGIGGEREDGREHGWAGTRGDEGGEGGEEGGGEGGEGSGESAGARAALAGWSRRAGLLGATSTSTSTSSSSSSSPSPGSLSSSAREAGPGYRLGTRATDGDYSQYKQEFRGEVARLRSTLDGRAPTRAPATGVGERTRLFPDFVLDGADEDRADGADADRADAAGPADLEAAPVGAWPQFLTCLPGPLALFEYEGALLSLDLRRLRADLVRRRLVGELAETKAGERVPAQGLLEPAVIRRRGEDLALLLRSREALAELGLELEGFGEDAVIVRAVPAALRKLLAPWEIGNLLDRLQPWLVMRARSTAPQDPNDDRGGFVDAVAELASAQTIDASPRLARRWLAEALRVHQGELAAIPGLRRLGVDELIA